MKQPKQTSRGAERLEYIHRLCVTVLGVHPPIWRRLEVPSAWPIDFAAYAISASLGWSSDHGCEFVIKKRHYGTPTHWVRNDPDHLYAEKVRELKRQDLPLRVYRKALHEIGKLCEELRLSNEAGEGVIPSLGELVPRPRTKFMFTYDFGDCWDHSVVVEKVEPAVAGQRYPRCTDGAGANPLEDCGGAHVMNAVLHAIRNPDQPRDPMVKHILNDWLQPGWDPLVFSVEKANALLD